jgi:hypothetical protein
VLARRQAGLAESLTDAKSELRLFQERVRAVQQVRRHARRKQAAFPRLSQAATAQRIWVGWSPKPQGTENARLTVMMTDGREGCVASCSFLMLKEEVLLSSLFRIHSRRSPSGTYDVDAHVCDALSFVVIKLLRAEWVQLDGILTSPSPNT